MALLRRAPTASLRTSTHGLAGDGWAARWHAISATAARASEHFIDRVSNTALRYHTLPVGRTPWSARNPLVPFVGILHRLAKAGPAGPAAQKNFMMRSGRQSLATRGVVHLSETVWMHL